MIIVWIPTSKTPVKNGSKYKHAFENSFYKIVTILFKMQAIFWLTESVMKCAQQNWYLIALGPKPRLGDWVDCPQDGDCPQMTYKWPKLPILSWLERELNH